MKRKLQGLEKREIDISSENTKFWALKVLLLKIQIFWDVTPR